MWTSYRYAIGSKTYVASLAYDIPQHYYNKLSPERRRFTAEDIRREIYEHLRFLPFGYQIHRMTNEDKFNPLDTLFTFIQAQGVGSYDELLTYANINYDAHTGRYLFERKVPQIKTYFTVNDLDDLLPLGDVRKLLRRHGAYSRERQDNVPYMAAQACSGSGPERLSEKGRFRMGAYMV